MSNAVVLVSLLALAGCTTSALPVSDANLTKGKQSAAGAADNSQQGPAEVPHRNPKMDGPPGY
jgi:hypothetical protein